MRASKNQIKFGTEKLCIVLRELMLAVTVLWVREYERAFIFPSRQIDIDSCGCF